MNTCLVVGGGGHAKVLLSVLKKDRSFRVLGYTDLLDKGRILDVPYLGNDDSLEEIKVKQGELAAVIGIGYVTISELRMRLSRRLREIQYQLPCIVSKDAIVNESVEIGEGTVVFDGAVVNSGAVIGQCAIVNTNSTIEHDCVIGDFVHVAPGATLSGGVKVGQKSLIGTGAQIIEGLTVCESCIVGAGSTVTRDIVEPGTYAGNPVRRIR